MIHSLLEQRLNNYLFMKMVALHWAIVLLLTGLTDASPAAPTEATLMGSGRHFPHEVQTAEIPAGEA